MRRACIIGRIDLGTTVGSWNVHRRIVILNMLWRLVGLHLPGKSMTACTHMQLVSRRLAGLQALECRGQEMVLTRSRS